MKNFMEKQEKNKTLYYMLGVNLVSYLLCSTTDMIQFYSFENKVEIKSGVFIIFQKISKAIAVHKTTRIYLH